MLVVVCLLTLSILARCWVCCGVDRGKLKCSNMGKNRRVKKENESKGRGKGSKAGRL